MGKDDHLIISVEEQGKLGIPWCVSCVGWHPDKIPGMKEFSRRLTSAAHDILIASAEFKKWEIRKLYKNKSCMLCGTTYKDDGNPDHTFKITAKRVKLELEAAGVFGVGDDKIEQIVALGRQSCKRLIRDRFKIHPSRWQYMSFSGIVATVITQAQEGRRAKNDPLGFIPGMFSKGTKKT